MGKKHVLIVEDNQDLQALLRLRLEYQGFQCTSAFTVADGLTALKYSDVDLILLDLCFPGFNGIDFINCMHKHLSSEYENIPPVVVMSCMNDPDVTKYLKDEGIVEFLPKPVDSNKLLQIVYTYSY